MLAPCRRFSFPSFRSAAPPSQSCLRGTTDYRVNALDGQPFFCATRPIDPGLIKTLEEDIIQGLLEDIPIPPTASNTSH
jgi:hypothetical protein